MKIKRFLFIVIISTIALLALFCDSEQGNIPTKSRQEHSSPRIALAMQDEPPPLTNSNDIDQLFGHWEGTLHFWGEGPSIEEFATFEISNQCSETTYCLFYSVPDFTDFGPIEMILDPETAVLMQEDICFSHFVTLPDDSESNTYAELTYCLIPISQNEIQVNGTGPLTGIGGNMTRQAFSCENVSGVSQEECEALVALYNNTGGPNWTNNSGWLVTNDVCTWYGINCQMLLGKLNHIMLENNGLSGTIPPEISNLSLNWLSLAGNELYGALPDSLGDLSVSNLVISDTNLEGPLPLSMAQMAMIQVFDFSGTNLCVPDDPGIQSWMQSGALFLSSEINCVSSTDRAAGDNQTVDNEVIEPIENLPLLLAEKRQIIDFLEKPTDQNELDDKILLAIANEMDTSFGYDESQAISIADHIEDTYELYLDGALDENEINDFKAEVDAFGRLVLVERAAKEQYQYAYDTANDISNTLIDVVGIGLGIIQAAQLKDIPPGANPFSEASLKLKAKLYSQVLDAINSVWEIVLNETEDAGTRHQYQQLREQLFRAVKLRLEAGDTVLDIILDEGVQRFVSLVITGIHIDRTGPTLVQAADSVPILAKNRAQVTGSLKTAETYNELLIGNSKQETERVHGVYKRFEEGSNVLELAADIGAVGKKTFVGAWVFFVSTLGDIVLEETKFTCGLDHLTYLRESLEFSRQFVFDADSADFSNSPSADHCRPFEWWPQSKNDRSQVIAKRISLQDDESGDIFIPDNMQEVVSNLLTAVEGIKDPDSQSVSELLAAIDSYITAESDARTALNLFQGSIDQDDLRNEEIYQLHDTGRQVSEHSMRFTAALLAALDDPNNEELWEQVAQIGQELRSAGTKYQVELEGADDITRQQLEGNPRIAGLNFPLTNNAGGKTTGIVTIFTPAAGLSDQFVLEAAAIDDGFIELTPAPLTLAQGKSEHEFAMNLGEEADVRLVEIQLSDGQQVVDSKIAAIEVLSTGELSVEAMPASSTEITDPESTPVAKEETSGIQQARNILFASGIVLLLIGGGLLVAGVIRKENAQSLYGLIVGGAAVLLIGGVLLFLAAAGWNFLVGVDDSDEAQQIETTAQTDLSNDQIGLTPESAVNVVVETDQEVEQIATAEPPTAQAAATFEADATLESNSDDGIVSYPTEAPEDRTVPLPSPTAEIVERERPVFGVEELGNTVPEPLSLSELTGLGFITYVRYPGGNLPKEIYRINADGSDRQFLTNGISPSVSGDGKWIAFGNDTEPADIFLINSTGNDVRQLTDGQSHDVDAIWSPDDLEILFRSDQEPHVINVETGQVRAEYPDFAPITATIGPYLGWSAGSCRVNLEEWTNKLNVCLSNGDEKIDIIGKLIPANILVSTDPWSPDDRFLVLDDNFRLYIFEIETGRYAQLPIEGRVTDAHWAPFPDG